MKVLSRFFQNIGIKEPRRLVVEPKDPWDPPMPIDDRMELLVSPDRDEARLVAGRIADFFYEHTIHMYLPNRGRVRVFASHEAWNIAVCVIDQFDRLTGLVKPGETLIGSGATVHYPKDADCGVVIKEAGEPE